MVKTSREQQSVAHWPIAMTDLAQLQNRGAPASKSGVGSLTWGTWPGTTWRPDATCGQAEGAAALAKIQRAWEAVLRTPEEIILNQETVE
jgi:hypothetical protein